MRKRDILLVLGVFLFAFMSFVVSAQPFIQQGDLTRGYAIKVPPQPILLQNEDYNFHFHVYNISDGMPISNASVGCYYHLYNSSGNHIVQTEAAHDTNNVNNEWEVDVLGGNFSTIGEYSYVVQCNSTILGGYTNVEFEVTPNGELQTTGQSLAIIAFLALMIAMTLMFGFMGFRLLGNDLFWVLGVFFIFLALIITIYDFWLGVEIYKNYIGIDNASLIPQVIFYIMFISITIGVIMAGLLLFKRIPEYVGMIFKGFVEKEDGWNKDAFK